MVAIVSGNGLGLFNTSLNTLGGSGVSGQAGFGQANGQAVVNAATGNLILQFTDEQLSGIGQDLPALRTYNALGQSNDGDADGWRWDGERRLILTGTVNTAGSTVTRINGDGHETLYTWNGSRYQSAEGRGAHDSLSWSSGDTTWTWVDGDTRSSEVYEAASGQSGQSRLKSVTATDGTSISYSYDAAGRLAGVRDSSGAELIYNYNAGGKLERLDTRLSGSDTPSKQVYYYYDAQGRLKRVLTDLTVDNSIADAGATPAGVLSAGAKVYVTDYTYDDANGVFSRRIASVSQSDGGSVSFTYQQVPAGGEYRLRTVTDASGVTTFDYGNLADRTTTVSNGLGQAWVYRYDESQRLVEVRSPSVAGQPLTTTAFSYDADSNVGMISSGGKTLTYGYDANGNRTLERDSLGNTLRRTYSITSRLLTETRYATASMYNSTTAVWTDPAIGQTTNYLYDSADRLRYFVSAEGRVTEYRYNAQGLPERVIQYGSAVYTSTMTEAALNTWVVSQDKTRTTLSFTQYDAYGNLAKRTDYASVDSTGNGLLDAAAVVTEYTYSGSGQLLQTIAVRGPDRSSKTTLASNVYDGLGRLQSQVDADGTHTNVYDGVARTLTVTHSSGRIVTNSYDTSGRLLTVAESGTGVLSRVTVFTYDLAGRLVAELDPAGGRRFTFYDEAGRVSARVDGVGAVTEYTYTATGGLSVERRYATRVDTSDWISSAGVMTKTLVSQIRPVATVADRQTAYAYDAADRLWTVTDAANVVTMNSYDARGQLIQTQTGDRISRYFYDKEGRPQAVLDGEGYLTENIYNAAGQLFQAKRYAVVTTPLQQAGATLTDVRPSATGALSTYYFYDAAGRRTGVLDEQQFLTETVYDAAGNAQQTIRYATPYTGSVASSTMLSTLKTALQASARQTSTTAYDSLGRVSTVTDTAGTVTAYEYDSYGRVVRETAAQGSSEERSTRNRYDAYSQVVGQLGGEASTRITSGMADASQAAVYRQFGAGYEYDALGRKSAFTDAAGNRTVYYYDAEGRLTHTISAEGEVSETIYNAFGEVQETTRYTTKLAPNQNDRATETTHSGNQAARIWYRAGTSNSSISRNLTGFLPSGETFQTGDVLTATVWFKADADTQGAMYVGSGGSGAYVRVSGNGQWQQIKVSYSATSSDPLSVYLYGDRDGASRVQGHNVIYDDLEVTCEARNFQYVDGFEGGLTGWSSSTQYKDIVTASSSSTFSGSGSARLWYQGGTPSTLSRNLGSVAAGDVVTATVWLKAGTDTRAAVYLGNSAGVATQSSWRESVGTGGWKKVSITVTATAAEDFYLYLNADAFNPAPSAAHSVTYDDVVVLKNGVAWLADGFDSGVTPAATVTATTGWFLQGARVDAARQSSVTSFDGSQSLQVAYKPGTSSYVVQALGSFAVGEVITATVWFKTTADTRARVALGGSGGGAISTSALDAYGVGDWQPLTVTGTVTAAGAIYIYLYADVNGGYKQEGHTVLFDNLEVASSTRGRIYSHDFESLTNINVGGGLSRLTGAEGREALQGGVLTTGLRALVQGIRNSAIDSRTQYRYDTRGLMISQTDGEGFESSFSYTDFGQLFQTTRQLTPGATPNTVVTENRYNKRGERIGVTEDLDPAGLNRVTSTKYDAFGRVIEQTDALGKLTTTKYDNNGRQITVTDPLVHARKSIYDAYGRVLTQTDVNGNSTSYAYDDVNRSVTVTTPEGITLSTWKTRHGETLKVVDGRGNATSYEYNLNGQLARSVDAQGNDNQNVYDAAGRLIQTTDAQGAQTRFEYDAANRVIRRLDEATTGNVTRYSFDGQGRQVRVTEGDGSLGQRITDYSYDRKGQMLTVTVDPAGQKLTTSYAYDGVGRQLRISRGDTANPAQQVMAYAYDDLGHRISETQDPEGLNLTTQYKYDLEGRLTRKIDALGNSTWYVNDAAGLLMYTVDGEGQVTRYYYDGNDRVISTLKYANVIAKATRDTYGDIVSATATAGTVTISAPAADAARDQRTFAVYDRDGRVRYQINALRQVTETRYDAAGNVTETITHERELPADTLIWPAAPNSPDTGFTALTSASQTLLNTYPGLFRYDSVSRRLVLCSVNNTASVNQTLIGPSRAFEPGQQYRMEITLGATLPSRLIVGLSNEGQSSTAGLSANNYRRHALYLSGGKWYSVINDNSISATPLLGVAAASTTYVLEIETRAGGTSLYVYEKGKTRAEGYKDEFDSIGWDEARFTLYGVQSPTDTNGEAYIDNLSISTRTSAAVVGSRTRYVYDSLNRQRFVIDPLGNVTEKCYDAAGHVTEVRRYDRAIPLETVATESDVGAALGLAGAGAQRTGYVYDSSGRQRFTVDALNQVTEARYDALGRVTDTIRHAAALTAGTVLSEAAVAAQLYPVWSDDLDDNGVSGMTVQNFTDVLSLSEGKLTLTNAMGAEAEPSVYESAFKTFTPGMTYHAEFSLGATLPKSFKIGLENSKNSYGATYRRHILFFDNGNLRSVAYSDKEEKSVLLGVAKANTTYVVEVETRAEGTTLYVHEKGQSRESGFSQSSDASVWADMRLRIWGRRNPAYDGSKVSIDNLQEWNLNGTQATLSSRTRTVYDAAGRAKFQLDPLNAVTEYVYDDAGRVVQEKRYSDALTAVPLTLTEGTLTTALLNKAAVTTTRVYDGAGRERFTVDALGYLSEQRFDALGHVIESLRYAEPVNANAPVTVTEADVVAQRTQYRYDLDGRVVYTVDALGNVTENRYDGLDRVTKTIRYAQKISVPASLVLSEIQAAVTAANGASPTDTATTNVVYDRLNRAVFSVDALGYVTGRQYDALGRMVKEIRYTQKPVGTVSYTEAWLSNTVNLSAAGAQVTRYAYDADNQLRYTVDALGYVTEQRFDSLGRVSATLKHAKAINADAVVTEADVDLQLKSLTVADLGSTLMPVGWKLGTYSGTTIVDGRLAVQPQANNALSTTQYPKVFEEQQLSAYQAGKVYRGEVTTGSSLSNAFVTLTLSDDNSPWKHSIEFNGGRIDGVTRAPGVSGGKMLGMAKINTTYVVEIETMADGTWAYVYEKGNNRDSGFSQWFAGSTSTSTWGTCSFRGVTVTGPSTTISTGPVIYLDNLSISSRSANPEASAQVTRYVYDADGQQRFSVDALGYVTERQYDSLGRVVKEVRYVEKPGDLTTWLANPGSLDVTGAQVTRYVYNANNQLRFTVDALGFVTEQRYDSLGRVTETLRYAGAINFADVSNESDFAIKLNAIQVVDFTGGALPSTWTHNPSVTSATLTQDQLSIKTGNSSSANDWPAVLSGSQLVNQTGTVYRTEVSTGSSLSGSSIWVSIDNTLPYSVAAGTSYRKHVVGFSATGIKIEGVNGQSVTPLTGALKTNATYVVEYVTEATGTTVYVYEKGGSRDSGLKHQLSGGAWANIKGFVQTYTGPAVTSGAAIYIDNISVSQPSKNPETDAQRTRYVYNANNQLRFTVDALGYVTEQRYDSLGRVTETLRYAGAINFADVSNESDFAIKLNAIQVVDFTGGALPSTWTHNPSVTSATLTQDQLSIKTGNSSSANDWPAVLSGSLLVNQTGTVYRTEVSTGSSLSGSSVWVSIDNGLTYSVAAGTSYRKHLVGFSATGIKIEGVNGQSVTPLTGALKTNATYVVEYVTEATGTTIYVYEKGGSRDSGLKHQLSGGAWANIKGFVQTYTGPAVTSGAAIYIDNISVSQPSKNPETDAQRTRYVYNANNQLRFTVDALGYVTERKYDGLGRVVKEIRYAEKPGDLTTWLANPGSLDVTGAQVTRYAYDVDNQLRFTVDALGYVTEQRYDSLGRVSATLKHAKAINVDAVVTEADVDLAVHSNLNVNFSDPVPSGMILTGNAALGSIANEQLAVRPQAAGALDWPPVFYEQSDAITYEAGKVYRAELTTGSSLAGIYTGFSIRNAQSGTGYRKHSIEFENGKAIIVSNGTNGVYAGGELGQLQANTTYVVEIETDSGGTSAYVYVKGGDRSTGWKHRLNATGWNTAQMRVFTKTGHGASGELSLDNVMISKRGAQPDVIAQQTRYVYDAEGRQIFTVDAEGYISERQYDGLGRVTAEIRYAVKPSNLTTWLSNPVSLGATDAQVTRYVYDANNQLRYTVDALGYVTEKQYDSFGRVIQESRYANLMTGSPQSLDYSTISSMALGEKQATTHLYNGLNQEVIQIDALGFVTETRFDGYGHITEKRKSAVAVDSIEGIMTETGRQSLLAASVAAINSVGVQTVMFVNDKLGRLRFSQDELGYVTESQYAANGAKTASIRYSEKYDVADYSEQALMTWSSSRLASKLIRTDFVNDKMGRLLFTVDPTVTGLTGRYVSELRYDANGNVVEQRRYTTAVTGLSLSESGMMSVLTGAVFVRQSRAVYDALGRVRYTLDALGYISENIYDNFGRVIEKRNYDRCLSETSELTESAVLDALAQPRWVNEEGLSSLILAMSTQPGQIQMQSLGLPGLGFDIPFGFVVDRMPVAARAGQKIRMEVRSDTTGYYQLWFQSGSRRHGVDIKNGSFRFVFDVNNSDNIAPVFDPRGSITSMATYILEMEVTATGTALSWYEKGQPPTTGYSDFEAGVLENDIALGAFSYEYPSTTTDWGNLYLSSIVTSAPQIATLEKYSYDNGGRLQSTTDSLGFTESYIYDAFGNRTKKTDKKGEEWNYLYDSLNRLVEEVTPALTVQADYSSVPVTGFVVNRNYYDSFGNVVSRQEGIVRKGTQPRVSNGNDEFNQVRTTRYGYDSLNRQVLIISPGYYDTLNRRFNALELSESELTARLGGVAPSDPTGGFLVSTRNYYDGFGRLSQTRVRINNTGVYADDYADSFRFYDARDQLRSEIDALGYVTGYDYDCYGNQVSQKRYASALANVADIAQDGVLVDDEIVKDAVRDRTIFSRYDELGRKIGIWQDAINLYTTPSGSVVATPATRFEYDSMGNVVRESREAWDLAGNMVTSLPASITRSFYDAKGRRIGVIDPLAYYTSYTYDVLDHVVSQREYAGQFGTNVDQLTFSGVSAKAELQESAYLNPQNRYTYFQYDVMGRLVRTYVETKGYIVGSAAQQVSATEYDEAGLVRSVTDKAGNITQTVYDNAGRVIKVIDPEREAAGLGALRANMAMIKASPEKNYILNAHGEVVKETVSAGVDANGGIQIGGSRITRNVYDASGNLIAMINPDVKDTDVNFNALRSSYGVNNYQIDASGNIICDTQKVKAVFTAWLVEGVAKQYDYSIQTSYAYDKLNRQKSTGVDGAVAYGNDSLLALVNTGYGRTEQSAMYNAFGEVSSRALNGETQIVYDYDQLGHVKSTVDGEGLSTFEYDHLGNGTRQTKKGADTDQYNRNHDIGYTYLAGNQSLFAVSDAANANAPRIERVTLRLFDLLGRETAQQLPSFKDYVGTTVYPVSYKIYDRWGNATEMNDNGTVVQYQYDMFNRVIRVESPASVITDEHGGEALANMIKEYSYDSMDNVIAESDTRGQYFDSQGITVAAVAVRFKSRNYYAGTNLLKDDFDANFAGVGSSSKNSYQYDAFGNQITKVNGAGNLSFMYYDSMDRLVSHGYINNINIAVIEDSYKYDYAGRQYAKIRGGGEEVAETLIYDDVNLVLSGDAGNVEYFEYDERGNVVLTHDESGVSKRFIYDVNNRKIAETMPFMSLYSRRYWAYDSYGRVVMTIDGDVCCAFAYDRFGQLSMEGGETSVTYPSYPNNWRSAKAYTYLDNGLLSKVAGEHNWSSYQYNVRSQKMQEENGYSVLVNGAAFSGSQKVNYMYDSLGRLSRMWAPAGTVAVNNSTRTSSFKWGDVTTITASIANTSELYSLNIAYDAFGNRRKVSLKATASSGVEENWYKYDAEGRMTIAEGFLNANHEIVMGLYAGKSKGLSITYDSAGRRATEESFKASLFFGDQYQQKRFTYQTNGELLQIDSRINVRGRLNGELRDSSTPYYSGYYNLYTGGLGTYVTTTRFTPSLLGVTQQLNYNESSGALVDVQSFYYRGDGKLYLQTTSNASMQVTQDNLYGGKYKLFADDPVPTRDRIDRDGLQIEYEIRNRVSPGSLSIASTAKYTKYYAWVNGSSKDDYIGVTYTGAGYTPGGSDFYHSDRGDLTQVKGAGGQVYDRRFTSNADGKMYFRGDYNTAGQLTAGQTYFYFNGNPIANIGTISGTEFGTEFTSVSDSYPSRTPSSYNINSGDTFASIAQSVWGDSNLGYLIADANGLNLTDNLSALVGRVIDIPNRVTNIHNDSTVFGVYDPGKIMGDTTPQPKAPPPPKPKKVKWWKKVLIALVSVAAMFIFGPIAGSIIGNIASQLTARVLGVTHEFSWKQVGKSFVSAIVSFGVGQFLGQFKSINDLSNAANSIANNGMRSLSDVATLAKSALVNGATSYAADYLANKSMNIDTHFSWSGVASSVVGSGLGSLVSAGHSSVAGDFNDVIRISARDQVSALASARLNDKWFGGDRPSYSDVAYSTLGSSLGKQFGLRHQNDDWASKTRGAIEDWSKKGVDYLRAAIKGTDPINSESLKPKQTKVNIELPEITLSDLGIAPIDELNFTEPMPYKNPLWQAAETTSFIDSLIDSSMPATFNHPSYHADLGGLGGKAKTILETEIDIELSQGYSERNGMTMPYPVGYDPRTGKKLPELRPTDSAYKARMRAIIAEKAKAEIKTDAATSSVFTMATVGLALNDPNVTPDQLEGAFQTGEALTNMVVGRSLKSNRYAPTKVEQRLISEVVRPTAKVSYKQDMVKVDSANIKLRTMGSTGNRDSLIGELIADSNKKFPLTEVNARKMLYEYAPDGYTPRKVAGPGGAGADLVFDGPGGAVFKIENKSTTSFGSFKDELSHAAQRQAQGNLVFVQVPEGVDVSKWMSRFWGYRKDLYNNPTPENIAKLDLYRKTEIVIHDEKGVNLLPRQPIYNPK